MEFPSLKKDELFGSRDARKIWLKYCGFLDLAIHEFMAIQRALLMDQINLVQDCQLGWNIMGGCRPESPEDFTRLVPYTTCEDYRPYFLEQDERVLAVKPVIWASSPGASEPIKWVPYTAASLERLADDALSAFILSSARRKGEVKVRSGTRVLINLPPVPYITGIMACAAQQRGGYGDIKLPNVTSAIEFSKGFKWNSSIVLRTRIDYAASTAEALAKAGDSFGRSFSPASTWHPVAVLHLVRGLITSKLAGRAMLPRDISRVKGLVCTDIDADIYREQILDQWGVPPLEAYLTTETGFIAMQGWNKKGMTCLPCSGFYEFIPVEAGVDQFVALARLYPIHRY